MSGDYAFSAKIVSPAKCNEKPWDSWIGEIGHLSPRADDAAFLEPAPAEGKGGGSRRVHDAHPYKGGGRARRSGLHRLRLASMSLHGLCPQIDDLNAAVCHMCGYTVKCSAAYRHLVEAHGAAEPLAPPPPPALPVRSRSRHKKEPPPPAPEPPRREPPRAEEPAPEVQVRVDPGDLPVVSIQDPEELPLGETLTDDIFAIMNSEGIQADDITNSADWKNIIRDIGNLQDFAQPGEPGELYAPLAYAVPDGELAALQFAAAPEPAPAPAPPPPRAAPPAPAAKHSRKSGKTKSTSREREYDPNKHCGVITADLKPCTRSLTCKAHALSLRRLVEGRAKLFDVLLAEHRASKDSASAGAAAALAGAAAPASAAELCAAAPASAAELGAFGALSAEQQVDDIYASLLRADEPVLPDTSSITSLLSQPMDFVLPDEAELPAPVPALGVASPESAARPAARPSDRPAARPGDRLATRPGDPPPADVCWYAASPRPLALCTYNASHAGGAVTLGKRYATVRSNIKSSLSRSTKTGTSNNFYYGQNALTLSKSVHMNASKSNKPEVRKLIVTCSDSGGKVQQTLNELFGGEVRHALNGHVSKARQPLKHGKGPTGLELGFLDPLLADEKC